MSLAEIKNAVEKLSPDQLTELASFIHQRENAAWDRQIDADFAEGGRLRPLLDEVRDDIRAGRFSDLHSVSPIPSRQKSQCCLRS